jgi:hypothetical protein
MAFIDSRPFLPGMIAIANLMESLSIIIANLVGIEINVLKTTGAGIFPGIVDSCAAISIIAMVRIHIHVSP